MVYNFHFFSSINFYLSFFLRDVLDKGLIHYK